MKTILQIHIESGKFNHGYLLAGDFENSRKLAFEAARVILKENKVESHPDFFYQKFDSFSIKNSHVFHRQAWATPFKAEAKVFVIEIISFSLESANSLLKIFEEPAQRTHFFILVPSSYDVLPTLLSRLTVMDFFGGRQVFSDNIILACDKFLSAEPKQRLDIISKFREKEDAEVFLNCMEEMLEKNINGAKAQGSLKEIKKCRDFLSARAASGKMIMEHIALVLPQML